MFGGSGFYSFLEDVERVEIATPFGSPSASVIIGSVGGRRVAFIPRHGERHQFPPHLVPYRANVWAMRSLGVERVFGPCASGSLKAGVKPGEFVVCDQIVDRTTGRPSTFHEGPQTTHVSFADPYCPEMRTVTIAEARRLGIPVHDRGTAVVVQGPRFSTRAESAFFARQGWEVINMTQMPEAVLVRELEMCYVGVALVTDHDVGVRDETEPVTQDEVFRVFTENNERLRGLLLRAISVMPDERSCPCGQALAGTRFEI